MSTSSSETSNSAALEPQTAIVLAGRRGGPDALAEAGGVSHRALLDIEGEPMLARVTRRLLSRPSVERVLINIDVPAALQHIPPLADEIAAGRVQLIQSTDSPSRSVLESLDRADLAAAPVLVTTADHALLDDAMLDAFYTAAGATTATAKAPDLSMGLVSRSVIQERFPAAQRTYLRFKEDGYSGANLFLFHTAAARRAAEFWQTAEAHRKQPWKLAHAFGWTSLLLFLSRQLSLEDAMRRASKVVRAQIQAVSLGIAEAAVDVDKMEDLALVREILASRRQAD